MTTFTDTDSIPDGEYIIRVSVENREEGKQYVCLRIEGGDVFPAYAGVIPGADGSPLMVPRVPRIRGGDPAGRTQNRAGV